MIATPDALVVVDSAPHVAPLHPAPLSAQFTPLFCESFVTVAVKPCVLPTLTLAEAGLTLTPIAAVTVIATDVLFVPSAIDVASSVTVAGLGTLAGALYVTVVVVVFVSVPQVAPLHPVPEIDHVTPLFPVSFVSVAVKFCVPIPACTLAEVGASVTTIGGAVVIVTVVESDLVESA